MRTQGPMRPRVSRRAARRVPRPPPPQHPLGNTSLAEAKGASRGRAVKGEPCRFYFRLRARASCLCFVRDNRQNNHWQNKPWQHKEGQAKGQHA